MMIYLIIVLAWFLQNVIHELSHLIAGKVFEGREFKKLIPFPHMHNGKFYFARYENGPATKNGNPKLRHIAPLITGIVLFLVFVILFITTQSIFMLPFAVCSLVDCCVWLFGYVFNRPLTDGFFFKGGGNV